MTMKDHQKRWQYALLIASMVCIGLFVSIASIGALTQTQASAAALIAPHGIQAPFDTDTPTDTNTAIPRATVTLTHTPCAPSCTPTNTRTRTFTRTTTS